MGSESDSNDFYKRLFNLDYPPAEPPKPNSWAELLRAIPPRPPVSAPPPDNSLSNLAALRALASIRTTSSLPSNLIAPPLPRPKPSPPVGGVSWAQSIVKAYLSRKADVAPGRILPGIDDLAVMEGRQIKAAFVYSDLHGFTKLVATQPVNKSFVFLHTFVEMATRLTKHYHGEVMDVAGDRVLSVFHRTANDFSKDPVEDAVTFALWFQTVFKEVIAPAFSGGGLGQLSLGIGIDYGDAIVGCVGIRGNKRIMFFGDAANNAAKLQDMAGPNETVLSAMASYMKPAYLNHASWTPTYVTLANNAIVARYNQVFLVTGDAPPKAR